MCGTKALAPSPPSTVASLITPNMTSDILPLAGFIAENFSVMVSDIWIDQEKQCYDNHYRTRTNDFLSSFLASIHEP